MNPLLRGSLLALLVLGAGCRATAPVVKEDAYTLAVESSLRDSPARAASAAWAFTAASDPDDPRYDRALRLVAVNLEELGLSWGAGQLYREIAQARRNMELLPESLSGLQRVVERGVYDEDALVTAFVAAESFGSLPPDSLAFVEFYRGLDLARRGQDAWAAQHFDVIPLDSPYAARAEYVRAVQLVSQRRDDEALALLHEIEAQDDLQPDLAHEVQRTMARIAFEYGHYDVALEHYEVLRDSAPDDPEILLEMAWTHYYLGDSRKALGLLLALDAPVHDTYIAPERYLLEALALRRLCQFGAARHAAVRLQRRHGDAIQALGKGALPEDIPSLRQAARQRGLSRTHARFHDQLQRERDSLDGMGLSLELRESLVELYDRGLAEAALREEQSLPADLDELTEELLMAEEGVRLIVHELSVALQRGRRRPAGVEEKAAEHIPVSGERVFYDFQDEFWTDELDDFVVVAEDRCID